VEVSDLPSLVPGHDSPLRELDISGSFSVNDGNRASQFLNSLSGRRVSDRSYVGGIAIRCQ